MCLRCQTLPTYQPTYLYESKPDVEALFTMRNDSNVSLFCLKAFQYEDFHILNNYTNVLAKEKLYTCCHI
jgi:hypothetical protein